jgi:hypothetical protein
MLSGIITRCARSSAKQQNCDTAPMALHDTYFVWSWELNLMVLLVKVVLVLGAAAHIKYLFFR